MTKAFLALLIMGLVLLPFNSIRGPSFLGELSSEASVFAFFPLVLLLLPSLLTKEFKKKNIPVELLVLMFAMLLAMVISWLLNADSLFVNELKGRSGVNKAATSAMVFLFGCMISLVVYNYSRSVKIYSEAIIPAMLVGVSVVIVGAIIELCGNYNWAFHEIYNYISYAVRSSGNDSLLPGRLRSVCEEPSFLALYLGFASIWVAYAYSTASTDKGRYIFGALLFVLTLIFLLTGSRTAYVVIAGQFFSMILFPIALRNLPNFSVTTKTTATLALLAAVFIGLNVLSRDNHLMRHIVDGDSVSNLSRFASNYVAFQLFDAHPLFGVGFGQYAFAGSTEMPDWGWKSWEIRDWYFNPVKAWPPVYSMPGRIAAEMGVLGLLAWYGSISWLFWRLWEKARSELLRRGALPRLGLCLLSGMVYVYTQGVGQESFRQFGAWIVLGLACAYVRTSSPEDRWTAVRK